LRFDSKLKLN